MDPSFFCVCFYFNTAYYTPILSLLLEKLTGQKSPSLANRNSPRCGSSRLACAAYHWLFISSLFMAAVTRATLSFANREKKNTLCSFVSLSFLLENKFTLIFAPEILLSTALLPLRPPSSPWSPPPLSFRPSSPPWRRLRGPRAPSRHGRVSRYPLVPLEL